MSLEDINKAKEVVRELEKELHPYLIFDDTVLLAIDMQGGMCDRLMLGRKGLIANANASIECWNIDRDEDEIMDLLPTRNFTVEVLEHALNVLYTDNFAVVKTDKTIITEEYIVGKDLAVIDSKLTTVDLYDVKFDENGLYKIL